MNIRRLVAASIRMLIGAALVMLLLEMVCGGASEKSGAQPPVGQTETVDVNKIISEFTAREAESRLAFANYGYKCDVRIQTIRDGSITGEYHRTTLVALDKNGKPVEKVLTFPKPTLTELSITRDDLDDLSPKWQFGLETANASKYKFSYAGKERVEDVDSYVFAVNPKGPPSRERLYSGRIWVRASDFKIIKLRGRGVMKGNQRFPMMESRRVVVADQYLFPSYFFADETLVFEQGPPVHMRMEVRFTDYVKLK